MPAQTAGRVLELKIKTDVVSPLVSSHCFSESITRKVLERAIGPYTSDTPIPGLLAEIEQILEKACREDAAVKTECSFR